MKVIESKVYSADEVDDRLAPIIAEIRSVYEPEKVILFGSAAHGLPWHDLDLLVSAETKDTFYERLLKIAGAFAKRQHTPNDIVVITPDELQKGIAEDRFFLVEEVLKKGRTVYEGDRSKRVAEDRQGRYDVGSR